MEHLHSSRGQTSFHESHSQQYLLSFLGCHKLAHSLFHLYLLSYLNWSLFCIVFIYFIRNQFFHIRLFLTWKIKIKQIAKADCFVIWTRKLNLIILSPECLLGNRLKRNQSMTSWILIRLSLICFSFHSFALSIYLSFTSNHLTFAFPS